MTSDPAAFRYFHFVRLIDTRVKYGSRPIVERERDRDDVVDTAATLNFVNQPLSNETWILNVRLNEARRKMCTRSWYVGFEDASKRKMSKFRRERSVCFEENIHQLVFKMGAKECRKGVDSFESERIEKNIRKSVSDRSKGFKTLESREKVCSENEKKGISGSRMFRLRRKGSFESKT